MSCFSAKTANPNVAEADPTKHVNYNVGMVLGVDDFTQEFAYLSGRDQWMARDLIGYGTVRGLKVGIDVDTVKGPRVAVESGVAVSPRGQMICVPSAQCAYLRDAVESRSAEVEQHLGSTPDSVELYVVLCYRDCPTDNVPIAGEPCRSEDELTAPSRLTDSFHLELRFEKPKQREEEAVRDFVAWLKQVEVNETVTSTPLDEFVQEIRAAAHAWFGSPPASPPDDFMAGVPSSVINSADLCDYMRAAFRIWVTELRPKWIARWHGCAATHFDVDDKTEEDCVLLAELIVPVIASSAGTWTVADSPAVEVDERHRPFVVHLRMLQEWLWCGSCCSGGVQSIVSGAPLGSSVGRYEIVAAGIVKADGSSREPVFNGLVASLQPGGQIALNFNDYTRPAGTFQYIVKALVVFQSGTGNAEVAFHSFGPTGTGILMNISGVNTAIMSGLELMVEISRYEAGGE